MLIEQFHQSVALTGLIRSVKIGYIAPVGSPRYDQFSVWQYVGFVRHFTEIARISEKIVRFFEQINFPF